MSDTSSAYGSESRSIEIPDDLSELKEDFQILAANAEPDMFDWAKRLAGSHVAHYKSVFSYINRISSNQTIRKVADVGAVPGFITVTLKQSGFDVQAVDINPERTKGIFASADIPAHKADVEKERLPFEDGQLDLVLFNEILEHLRIDPIFALRETFRVLKPGGSALFSTPNITPIMRWRFLRGHDYQGDIIAEFAKLEKIGHMGHIRLYSQNEVERLLKFVGYEIHQSTLEGPVRRGRSVVRLGLRMLFRNKMRPHLYVWALKPAA